jgi:hypothetical protein
VPTDEVVRVTGDLLTANGARCGWSATYRERDDGAALLARDALELLRRFALVERTDAGWVPRPAIARFAPAPPAGTAGPQARLDPRRARVTPAPPAPGARP